MIIESTVTEVKSNYINTTVVLQFVNPSLAIDPFVSHDGTAVVHIDEHTNLNIHIKQDQATLLLEWARNLVKSFDNISNSKDDTNE